MERILLMTALLVGGLFAGLASTGHASATLDVCPSGCTYATIQSAVDAAAPGDTVVVGAGTYNESVVVDKALALLGAKVGLNAKTRAAAGESIVNASGLAAITVTAGDVLVDGFSLVSTCSAPDKVGVLLQNNAGAVAVKHNRIGGHTIGVALYGAAPAHFERNFLFANNCPGAASGDGFYTDASTTGITLVSNDFAGHASAAMVFATANGATHTNLLVKGNRFVNDNSVALFAVQNGRVEANVMSGAAGSGVFVGGGVSGLVIFGNEILNGQARAIRVLDLLGQPNQDVVVRQNKIAGNAGDGLAVGAGAHVGTLDARHNFWGSSLGPNGGGWPGNGQAVSGDADATLFCIDGGCSTARLFP